MDNDIYFDIKTIMKRFIKKGCYETYTAADIFYFHNMRSKRDAFLTFIDSFYGDSYGIQLFTNRDGFNYVHDIFTADSDDPSQIVECDCICAVFISGENLTKEEKEYLNNRHVRVYPEHNLVLYRFKRGYDRSFANKKEEREAFKYIEFLDSLIRNDRDYIEVALREEMTVYCDIDFKDYEYNLIPRSLPLLEKKHRNLALNEAIYNELKDDLFINDDVILYTSFLPFLVGDLIKDERVRPLGVFLVYPRTDRIYFGYIIDDPSEYPAKLWTIIYDAFKELGKPASIICNHRDIYASLKNTLEKLNIEIKRDKNEYRKYEGIQSLLARFYTDELIECNMTLAQASDLIKAFRDTVNSLSYSDSSLSEYEDEEINSNDDTLVS